MLNVRHGNWNRGGVFTRAHVVVGGISSVIIITGLSAANAIGHGVSSDVRSTDTSKQASQKTNMSTQDGNRLQVDTSPESVQPQTSYTETSDGQTTTKQYKTTYDDKKGTRVTQQQTYTTDANGSAIDVHLNSESSSSSNSSSFVNVNVNSESEVSSSSSP